ncbi:hypothetical protein QYM36_016170 [Artemia franciscana]|uniref:HTH psq-type domain-containing protein n=1 Tax=Artemia franciscana TaxID=6661 RepID=A0AA88H6H5_ARTSF|nr:hypothetical protein QYM36_016170 [Artemia franciscana]
MTRTYERKPDARLAFPMEAFVKAVEAVKNGAKIYTAGKDYGVPYSTLRNHTKGLHLKKVGGRTVPRMNEETVLPI